ncbi:MAG: glycoside hydrolase domain-containing protein [Chloroflexota bacterium]
MSDDPVVAYQQGADEAVAAVDAAAALGLTLPDKTGTVIYYDLESYNVNNAACKEAATAFISGWTDQIEASGNIAGVYGSTCTSGLDAIAALPNPPEAAWLANWVHYAPGGYYDPDASVWNVSCLSSSFWTNRTRLRQYEGSHTEVWGGLGLNIDSNVLDGIVAAIPGSGPAARVVDDASYLVTYGGWDNYQSAAAYGGGYRYTSQAGQVLACKKNVNVATVFVLAYRGPDQGKAQITVDGTVVKTVDLYRAEPLWVSIRIPNLPKQAHTIVVKALGTKRPASKGAQVRVAGCRFGGTYTDDLSYDFIRLGVWNAKNDARLPDGWFRISGVKWAQLSFHVSGTAFTWKTAAGPWYGKAQILVDGTPLQTVDLYQPKWSLKDIQISGLAEGDHEITIKVLRQKNPLSKGFGVGFDGFTVP